MGFDLYAAGSGSRGTTDLKRQLGYDQLLSQLLERKMLLEWVQYKRDHPECNSKLFVDSGAFSSFTRGKQVDVDDYIELINSIDDQVYVFAQVDKIPGEWGKPKTPEQIAEAPRLSWENYLYMVTRVKSPEKLLPIFHQGEDFSWLQNMLDYTYTEGPLKGQHIKYIGLSCSKDIQSSAWAPWFDLCFKMIHESDNPDVKTHAFGMTSLKLLEQFPFTSADSTSWIRSAGFGNIIIGGTTVYTSAQNPNDPGYIKNLNAALKHDIDVIARKYGYSFFELADEARTFEREAYLVKINKAFTEFVEKIKPYVPEADNTLVTDNVYLCDIKEQVMEKARAYMRALPEGDYRLFAMMSKDLDTLQEQLGEVKSIGEIRSLFNLCSLKEWADHYEFTGTHDFKENLW